MPPPYKVTRIEEWEEVEDAALASKRCIQPQRDMAEPGTNWKKAQETWEALGERVIYFAICEANYPQTLLGYVRLFNTTPEVSANPTWIVDYMWPISAEVIVMVAETLKGTVMTKSYFNNDLLTRRWPRVALSLNVPEAPYRVQTESLADWLVVVP